MTTTIKTIAPISIDDLKKYFADKDTKYIIDYSTSKLQGIKLLTYLSNLDIPCDIEIDNTSDEFFELLKDYLNCPFIVNVDMLEKATILLLFTYKGIIQDNTFSKFISENSKIVNDWITILDSCTIYNMSILDCEEFNEFVKSHPVAEEENTQGINFVSLLKHEVFYDFYEIIDQRKLKYYPKYFKEYMFKGKNLFNYWAIIDNPLFLLTHGIANGHINEALTPTD